MITQSDINGARNFLFGAYYDEFRAGRTVTKALVEMNLAHADRVAANAAKIADGEGLDINFLRLAATLHDVAKLDHKDSGGIDTFHHHYLGAAVARKFILQILKKSIHEANVVFEAIDRHSCIPFIKRYWQKVYGASIPGPQTYFEIALRDADTLDQVGVGGMHKIVHFRQVPESDFYKEDGGDIRKAIESAEKSCREAAGEVITTATAKNLAVALLKENMEFRTALAADHIQTLHKFDAVYEKFLKR